MLAHARAERAEAATYTALSSLATGNVEALNSTRSLQHPSSTAQDGSESTRGPLGDVPDPLAPPPFPARTSRHSDTSSLALRTERNARASPLLRLLPEIRNLIYHHALGGQLIHIEYKPPGHAPRREDIFVRGGLWNRANPLTDARSVGFYWHRYGRRMSEHMRLPRNEYKPALLRVCRQVYDEACLVPYCDNVFSFGTRQCFQRFLRSATLRQDQISSIRYMVGMDQVVAAQAAGLAGLRKIYIFPQLVVREDRAEYSETWSELPAAVVPVYLEQEFKVYRKGWFGDGYGDGAPTVIQKYPVWREAQGSAHCPVVASSDH